VLTAAVETPGLYVARSDLVPADGVVNAPVPVVHLPLRGVTVFDPPLLTAIPLLRLPPSSCSDAS